MATNGITAARQSWRPLLVCPQRDLAKGVRTAFAELNLGPVTDLPEYPRRGGLAATAAQGECNACFLDVASNTEHASLLIAEAAALMPVIALSSRKDADLILRCLHLGAGDFLVSPTAGQVQASLENLARQRAPASPPSPSVVYCVLPGKPGCGASTLAIHLALELKRAGAAQVLLVDTDVLSGSVAFLLKLKPDFHIGDAVRDRERLDDDLWGRLVVASHGIDVLLAPEDPSTALELGRESAQQLVSFWRGRYEAIVLDMAGALPATLELLRLADQILLVATNELVALHAARRSVEFLEHNGIERKRLRLLVNRYAPATGLRREQVQAALKLEPYALLANEYEVVQQAVLEGRPVMAGSRFDRGVRALAARLTGKAAPAEKRPSWLGLLPKRGSHAEYKI